MKTIHLRKLTAIMEVKGRTLFSKNLIIMPAFSLAFTYLIKMIYGNIDIGVDTSGYALSMGVLMNICMTGIYCVAALLAEEKEKHNGELARLTARRENMEKEYDEIVAKLFDEYELTRSQAEEIGVPISDEKAAARRLNELKLRIRQLGSVNVAAIEEYKEVAERYTFLKAQIADVQNAKEELYKLIQSLTDKMKTLFIQRFDAISRYFTEVFKELFGGGTAQLRLSDPANVLETGIEIIAQPPGKNISIIEQLSGGEKALIAVAIYFAIMKVNPPPFCLLDEVEAALDEVNVDRFAAYLRRMSHDTQFIIITHRRGTMEEADVLYGVTMQEKGVSKLLSIDVSQIESTLSKQAR